MSTKRALVLRLLERKSPMTVKEILQDLGLEHSNATGVSSLLRRAVDAGIVTRTRLRTTPKVYSYSWIPGSDVFKQGLYAKRARQIRPPSQVVAKPPKVLEFLLEYHRQAVFAAETEDSALRHLQAVHWLESLN